MRWYWEGGAVSLDEAARQLESAIHDARVSFDCIGLGNLEQAHTSAITARAAVDAAENAIRVALEQAEEAELDKGTSEEQAR